MAFIDSSSRSFATVPLSFSSLRDEQRSDVQYRHLNELRERDINLKAELVLAK